jgi:hypothetical protein
LEKILGGNMWEIMLIKSEVFQFPKRGAQVSYWGSVIAEEKNLNKTIKLMKEAKSFTDKQATKDFFLGINDEEDFVMSNYSYLWAMDKYDLDDLAKNLKTLKDATMPLITKNISEEQSKRRGKTANVPEEKRRGRYSWKKKNWQENIDFLIADIDEGRDVKENVKGLNAFIEDEPSYVKSNPIQSEDRKKLLLGLKNHKVLTTTRAEVLFDIKDESFEDEVKTSLKGIFEDWETKEESAAILFSKVFTTDNVDDDLKTLMADTSTSLQEIGVPSGAVVLGNEYPKLKKSALATHLGYKSAQQVGELELEPEKNYRVDNINTKKVKTYIHQFLTTTYLTKYLNELLPQGGKNYTGSLLGEIFVKRSAGNRPRLNRYLDVLLEENLDTVKADDYFETFRKALATRMFTNENKIRTDFIRDAVNIFLLENNRRDFVTPFSQKEGKDRMTPEELVEYTKMVKESIKGKINYKLFSVIDGVSPQAKVKDIQDRIAELVSAGGEWSEAYNEYVAITQEKVDKALNSMTEPIMKYLMSILESDNLRRVSRRVGVSEKDLQYIKDNPQLTSEQGIKRMIGKEQITLFNFEDNKSRRIATEFVRNLRENQRAARGYEAWKRANPEFKSMLVQENAIKFLYDARGYQSPEFDNTDVTDKFDALTSLQKGVATIIYDTLKGETKDGETTRPKRIGDLFKGKVKQSAKQMDFLELIHVIVNADGDIGQQGRFMKLFDRIDSALDKNRDLDLTQAEELPLLREIKQFANAIQAALKSIRNGLIEITEAKLNDIIDNQKEYRKKFDREVVTNKKKGTKTYFKIMDRLVELGLIVEA